jgi:cardiolipin synthase
MPGSGSDLPLVQNMTRAGYRQLLQAGVRVFEWNGTMIHAKTAVADGKWARVGSSNLNIQSWLGNWELDVAVEDDRFAHEMEEMYLADLENATEIVLSEHHITRVAPPKGAAATGRTWPRARRTGRTRRAAAAGAIRFGQTFGAALTARRALGAAEAGQLIWGVVLLGALGFVGLNWPKGLAYPFGVFFLWLAAGWLIQAAKLWRRRERATVPAKTAEAKRENAA